MNPIVSIIVSTFNSEAFIRGRLEDLVRQTIFNNSEIIIVNSGSLQKEELVIDEFRHRHKNIYYIKTQQRETIYKAWNRGIALAKGKYITNGNTDDRLRYDALQVMSNYLDENPGIAMVYGDQYVSNVPNTTFERCINNTRNRSKPFSRMRLFCEYVLGSQPMWKSTLHSGDNIWFDEKYEVAGDYDFVLRVVEKYKIYYIPKVLGVYYKPDDKSNKEFQDSSRTMIESTKIQKKYVMRYLDSLSSSEYKILRARAKTWILLPKIIYTIMHRSIAHLDEQKQILNKSFWCWFGSLLEEHSGNIIEAIRLCSINRNHETVDRIKMQYEDLLSLQ
jgi:glycosyltransferase involved in cell wall biosynthesis